MKIKFPYYRVSMFLLGLTDIIGGVCAVCTLGFWYPDWSFSIIMWGLKNETKNKKSS